MSEYIPKYPSHEGDDSNKSSSELLAETLKPIYVPQELMLAWESHLAGYSRDTHVLLDQVKDSESALNSQYQALLARVQKYEQMLQDITMDSNEFLMDSDEVNFTGWNILAQASYWDYLLKKEITKLSDLIKSGKYRGGLVSEVSDAVLEGLIADNNYISNVIGALSDTPLIRELDETLNTTTSSLADLHEKYEELALKHAADAEAFAQQQVEKSEQLVEAINVSIAEQVDRIAQEATIRTQLLQELEDRTYEIEREALERSEAIADHLGIVIGEVTQNVGDITKRIDSEVAVRTQMIADQAKALVLESEARAAAISTQADALAAESLARRNAIKAQAEAINLEVTNRTQALKDQQEALSSQIVSTNESTLAAIETRAVALASDYNTKVINLNNKLTASIENLETGVTTRLTSLDDEDAKLLQNIEAYKTSNNGNVAAIRSDLTTLSTAHGTTATKVEGLTVSFTGLEGKVSKNTSSIATEVTARSNADSALGVRIDNLTASTSGKFTEVNSSITGVSEAVTSLEQATATRFTGLDSSISNVDDKADTAISNAASAQNTANTAVTTNTAQAEEISKLQGRLDTTEGDLLTKASADVVSGIITDVSNIEGELSVQATSIEDLSASLLLVDTKADTANTAAADAQTTANTAVSENVATANRVDTLESDMSKVQGDLTTKATASALELTNTEVIRLDGLTQTNSSSIIDLNNSLVTTNSNVSDALKAVTVTDNRDTAELPSWYWQNHPKRIVNEFKRASVLGVTGLGAYVNMETRVYYGDSSGGPIVQRVVGATDSTLEYVRRSSGTGADAVWTAWTQPLKAIKDDIETKASASALSSLDSRVTDIDGRVTSQATSINELDADLTETNNLLGTVQSTAASALDTANAAVTANDAQASDITQLQAKMSTAEGTLSRKADANALSSLETKVDNNQTATATRIDELTAAITDLGEGVETAVDTHAFNALKAEVNTAKGNITSNTTAITDLGSSLNTLDNTVQGIEQETAANANAIQDTSTLVSDIKGQVTSQGTSITNLRADLTTAQTTANNAASLAKTKADATAFNALDTKVTKIDGRVSSQASDITEIKADITDLDGKVDTKADSSALSALTTEVGEVDGKVTTNANALTKLGGRVSEVEGKVATKAEASALSDYYTKVQADDKAAEIAAGKVEEYDASLVIGGVNLVEKSKFMGGTQNPKDFTINLFAYAVLNAEAVASMFTEGETYTISFEYEIVGKPAASTPNISQLGFILYSASNPGAHADSRNNYLWWHTNTSGKPIGYKGKIVKTFTVVELYDDHRILAYTNRYSTNGVAPFETETVRFTNFQIEKGTKATAWSPSPEDVQNALDTNSTAIQTTSAEVSRVDDRVTATNSAQSLLEGRVKTVEGEVTKKADASALTALSTRVDTEEGKSLSQGNAITSLQNAINHATTGLASKAASTAVTAVDNKVTAANGRIDTTNSNVSKLTGRVSTVEGAVSTKAEAAALTALTTRVSNAEGVNTSQGSAITTLENSVNHATTGLTSKASSAALTSVDNKVTAANGRIDTTNSNVSTLSGRVSTVEGDVAKKADASALTALTTRVGNAEGVNTSQGSAITTLQNTVNHKTTGLAAKASTSALTATNSEVSRVNGLVTGHTNQLTQLESDITTINGTLATKANASALNDIYTKNQTDAKATEIAAGEVSKYNASLVIGGANLFANSDFSSGTAGWESTGTGASLSVVTDSEGKFKQVAKAVSISNSQGFKYTGAAASALKLVPGDTYTMSGWVRASEPMTLNPAIDGAGISNASPIQVDTAWQYFTITKKVVSNIIPRIYGNGEYFVANLKLEKGTKATDWTPSPQDTQDQIDVNATAIDNTNAKVARVDGRVTTESNRTTTLTGRVSTVEGNISKKADASALSALDTRVGTVEGQYTSQASDITKLNNSLDTTNVNVGTAQTAAQNAMNAAGAKGKVIFGNTAPVVADRLIQNLWIDTTSNANTPKRWNGSAWVVVTDKVATDAANAVKTLDAAVKTKADVSALNSLTTKVTDDAKKTVANTNSITELNSDITKINNNLATKANASALSDMYTKSQADTKATQIAAGEVAKYDASLVIGGSNLLNGTETFETWKNTFGSLTVTRNGTGIKGVWPGTAQSSLGIEFSDNLEQGANYVLSLEIRGNLNRFECFVLSSPSPNYKFFTVDNALSTTEFKRFVIPFSYNHPNTSANLFVGGIPSQAGQWIEIKAKTVKLEKGNKATAWTPSSADVQNSINANSTAIQNTNAEVSRVGGRVTTESNRITTLTGRVTNNEKGIALKADASALGGYYTKTAADQAIAGKLEAFSSALVIGGSNLLHNSNFAKAASSSAWSSNGGGYTKVTDPVVGSVVQTNLPNGLTHAWLKLDNGVEYVYSALIKPTNSHAMSGSVPLHYQAGLNNTNQNKISILEVSHTSIPGGVWSRVWIRFTLTGDADSFRPFIYGGAANTIQVAWTQLERGSKPTDWSPSSQDVQNQLDVNASAISNVYTKAETNSAITTATNSLKSQVDKNIATQNSTINTWVEQNKVEAAMVETMAAELVPHMAGNTELFAGVEINVGYKGVITALADTDSAIMTRIDTMESRYDNAFATIGTSEVVRTTAEEAAAHMATTIRAEFKAADTATKNTAVSDAATATNNALKSYTTTAALQQNFITKTDANTAISSATTTLQSSMRNEYTNAINAIDLDTLTIPDTRSANETPQWYWTNYTRKKITEFKFATTVGLTTAQVGNTYGTLTTIVPWTDSSGGPIRQIMEGSSEANVYVRVSTGTTTWGAWVKQGATLDVKILEQTQAVNGILGMKTVSIDNNGVMSGYGLISELKNGQVTSAFGVNADTFYIGKPTDKVKPFIVTTSGQEIDGITYPAGTYINSAIIANATIGTAHIADAAITNAKIANLSAEKITAGTINAARIGSKSITSDKINVGYLSAISANLGTIQVDTANIKDLAVETIKIDANAVTVMTAAQNVSQLTIDTNGGPVRIDAGVVIRHLVDLPNSVEIETIQVRITRNGVQLHASSYRDTYWYQNATHNIRHFSFIYDNCYPAYVDKPPAGRHVYAIELMKLNTTTGKRTGVWEPLKCSLSLLEVKR